MIWANLLHLSYNMWCDREVPEWDLKYISAKPYLRFDEDLWNELLEKMADAGMNMVVIDLGDGAKYNSHPEIAVENAWTVEKLQSEIGKARKMGLEPIPKLNFSTTHDTWLGPYSRAVSSDVYYRVCADLISEVMEIFEKPRFFHIGMDEETYEHQRYHEYVVVRQYDLWWKDFNFLVDQVERGGSRAWIWSDYVWQHPAPFFEKMPKSVLQSNWYYGEEFNTDINYVKAYNDLEAHGFEQVPAGSNWTTPENFGRTVAYCKEHIAPERLTGFLQTIWRPTLNECRDKHIWGIEQVKEAKGAF